jgi:hypothetical protein
MWDLELLRTVVHVKQEVLLRPLFMLHYRRLSVGSRLHLLAQQVFLLYQCVHVPLIRWQAGRPSSMRMLRKCDLRCSSVAGGVRATHRGPGTGGNDGCALSSMAGTT